MMGARESRGVLGTRWRTCRRALLTLGIGAVHLPILSVLALLPFLYAKITDDGLLHLRRLVRLKYLSLSGTRVTLEVIESLRTALPDCLFNDESAFLPLHFLLLMPPAS